jgi:hypothetical protein
VRTIESPPFYIGNMATDRYTVKHVSLVRLVASAVAWLLWFILQQSYTFLAMVGRLSQLYVTWIICWQPCVVAIVSLLHWFLGKILPGKELVVPPWACRFRASLHRGQTSAAPNLRARATLWNRRRPSEWRSSQFSRIPDRLCRRLD